ncbi:MAG: hypothetical protein AB8G86_18030 [Saprospiraceae bacterium]
MSKKTAAVTIDTGNDYVMSVKKNQPALHNKIENIINTTSPIDIAYTLEKPRIIFSPQIYVCYFSRFP